MFKACLLSLILVSSVVTGRAQQGPVASASPAGISSPASQANGDLSTRKSPAAVDDSRYRIGPGDVLEVRVLRAPELSRDAVRVDQRGKIRLPMLDDDIQAACLTESELAANIAKLYLKYKRNPNVDVFVREFQSQPVAVIGAVRSAAQFKLQRPVRLSELLSLAGGPSDAAGQTVQVVHAGGPSLCGKPSTGNTESDTSGFVSYRLSDTLHGVPEANPFARPGDLVQVLDADQVFILGNVNRPSAIPLKGPIPLTISRAIALVGGTSPSTRKSGVRIIRQLPGSTVKQEIHVNLTAVEKNKAEDVALMANDVVYVPSSAGKSILRGLFGTIVPTVSQLPVRVIP
jgi:polysaccharide export outer membrane protein